MILPFSTQLNGKPTYFVEKILTCLVLNRIITFEAVNTILENSHQNFDRSIIHNKKLHTIREDKKNRWKAGTKIDFFINTRQKNMFRFAPVLPVISTQKIEFIWKENPKNQKCLGISFDKTCTIIIDNCFFGDVLFFKGNLISASYNLPDFAKNDGFDTAEELFAYFNKNFKGKIIHWTYLKY